MDYDLIVVKTLERVYKNYYYIIRGEFLLCYVKYAVLLILDEPIITKALLSLAM